MNLISKLIKKDLIKGLTKINFKKSKIYDTYQLRKQIRSSLKSKYLVSAFRPSELFHIDLFGPTKNISMEKKIWTCDS